MDHSHPHSHPSLTVKNSFYSSPFHPNSERRSVYHTILSREYIASYHGLHHTRLLTNLKKSEYFIEKLSPWKILRGHDGCVNSVLFSDNGDYIFTGSDDTLINLYATHSGQLLRSIQTIHTQNIFYAKDFPQQSNHVDYLLSCGADGKVILTNIEQPTTTAGKLLYRHHGRSHRISLIPGEPYQFLTCGEDGICCLFDLREKLGDLFGNYQNLEIQEQLQEQLERNQLPSLKIQFRPRLLTPNASNTTATRTAPLQSAYCIGVNPFHPYEVAIGGTHTKVALFDIRNHQSAFGFLCPEHLMDSHVAHVTGLKYSYNGQHLLASYNDDDVYSFHIQRHTRLLQKENESESGEGRRRSLSGQASNGNGLFNNALNAMSSLWNRFRRPPPATAATTVATSETSLNRFDESEEELDGDLNAEEVGFQGYYRRYHGHRNSDTVKQVAFMGNQSEWVLSGSDCGHIFIWNTHTSKLTKVLEGDQVGAVNCLASHPHLPLLATSGLENNAKLWYPMSDATSLEKDEEEKEKVDSIIQSNRHRDQSFPISSRALRRIIRLLSQSAFAEQEEDDEEPTASTGSEDGRMAGGNTTSGTRRGSQEIDDGEGEGQQRRRRRRISLNEISALLPLISVAFGYGRNDSEEEEEEEEDEDEGDDEAENEEGVERRIRRSVSAMEEEDDEEEDESESGDEDDDDDDDDDDDEEEEEDDSGFGEELEDQEEQEDTEESDEEEEEEEKEETDLQSSFEMEDRNGGGRLMEVSEAETTKDLFDDDDDDNDEGEEQGQIKTAAMSSFDREAAVDATSSDDIHLIINEAELPRAIVGDHNES